MLYVLCVVLKKIYFEMNLKVIAIPNVLPVGPICLHTDPVKDALHGFAMAWKSQYASLLHEDAKVRVNVEQYIHAHKTFFHKHQNATTISELVLS